MNKYLGEVIGTFLLAGAVALSLTGKLPVPTPVIAGLTLGICVYTLGGISGTHINPAVTIGLLSIGKISVTEAAGYVVSQFVGAGLALALSNALAPHAPVTVMDSGAVFAAEALGTFCLGFGVAAVVHDKVPAPAAGLTIGGSLLLGVLMAANVSNGVLNPAVALGIGSVSVIYLVAPIVGSVIGMQLYRMLAK